MKPIPENERDLAVVVYKWLALLDNKLEFSYCKKEITTHQDFPAIIAVTDFLDSGNMNYQAVQADASYINEFNYPAIAHIKEPGNDYMHIILDVHSWEKEKHITQYWSGIVIFPEKNTKWQNDENNAETRKKQKQQLLLTIYGLIFALLLTSTIYVRPSLSYNTFGLLSLAGIILSTGAFAAQLGIQSSAVKQVCGSVNKDGCEKVLKSSYAKGVLGFTPGDLAVLYFVTQFICYIISSFNPEIFTILPYLATGGIFIAGISVYIQAKVLKQWCALCIGIACILTLQEVTILFNYTTISIGSISNFISIFLLLLVVLIPVKEMIRTNVNNEQKIAELKKWRLDIDLFILQLQKGKAADNSIWQEDIILGDKNAPITITVACNPYCGPCAVAHAQLDEMLHRFPGKIKVQMRLLCNPPNITDARTLAVSAILQRAILIKSDKELQQMLSDWFLWMNYKKWIKKWGVENVHDVSDLLIKHARWIKDNNITHTPTFFINGRHLPGRYGLNEVEKLIPQMTTIFLQQNSSKN